ncbi:hypothetical protein [Aliihoeflea sp. 2WW]|uniref:hypothetical protein n=1 Tax=Aliihoeflea sp. 2WW TaxID=1381123 RepID=UPI000465C3C0|nr:hypothetical protein [Aliihoeflea sp. 2WW]
MKATFLAGLASVLVTTTAMADRSVFVGEWAAAELCAEGIQCWIEIEQAAEGHSFTLVFADRMNAQDRKCEVSGVLRNPSSEHDYNISGSTDAGDVQLTWSAGDMRVQTTGWKACSRYEVQEHWFAFGDM